MRLYFYFLLAALLLLTACSHQVTNQEWLAVKARQSISEVEAHLGRPVKIDDAQILDTTGFIYHYKLPEGDGCVVFVNNFVYGKYILSPQPVSSPLHP